MSKGPRFKISSTRTDAPSVVDELIGRAPARPSTPPAPAGEPVDGVVVQAVNKFVDGADSSSTVNKFVDGQVPTLASCEQHIAAVTHQWLLGVGRALRAIRDHRLYEEAGYSSFEAYASHRWDMTRQRAHQLIKAVPVAEIIAPYADREIKEGQTRVLDPIREKHGNDVVVEVWQAASRFGKPTAAALERIAREKGYLDAAEDEEARGHASAPEPTHPVLVKLQAAVKVFDLRAVRQVAIENPEGARQLAQELRTVLTELEADL